MEAMRTRWSDERLDDLKASVDGLKGSVDRLDGRVDRLQHSMVIGFIAMGAMNPMTILTLFATHF
jgi:hypothetical protein